MSKSIYDEALDILLNSLQDPQDEGNVCYSLNLLQMNKITKTILQAQKQEKLLELYRELITAKDGLISIAYFGDNYYVKREAEKNVEKKIKELENE